MIRTFAPLLLCLSVPFLGGCAFLGYAAHAVGGGETQVQRYEGLAGQTVAVMVWAPSRLQTDYPFIRLHLGTAIQSKLVQEGQQELKRNSLKGAVFPYGVDSTMRFQDEHRDIEYQPIEAVAPRLGIDPQVAKATGRDHYTRVIYVEVQSLETRYPSSRDLFRGSATATLKIVEIPPTGPAQVVYEEPAISVMFPQKGPEAYPYDPGKYDDQSMYMGTLAVITKEVCRRLYEPKAE